MAKGYVGISKSKNGNVNYYLREDECLSFRHSSGLLERKRIQNEWKIIERNEVYGNKSLGIRGRHDARVRTNYTLSMPNEISPQECLDRVQNIINKTPISLCTYTIAVHRGKTKDVLNQHVHLLVNERLPDGKKDRVMQRKVWFEKTFRPLYQNEFSKELSQKVSHPKRERISTYLYQADPDKARAVIKEVNQVHKQPDLSQWASLGRALKEKEERELKEKERARQQKLEADKKQEAQWEKKRGRGRPF